MRATIIAFLLFVSAIPVSSQNEQQIGTGTYLLDQCTSFVNFMDHQPGQDTQKMDWCSGYISGASDVFDQVRLLGTKSFTDYQRHSPLGICPAPNVSIGQTARVVVKFLREHPADLHQPAGALTIVAFRNAFPCE